MSVVTTAPDPTMLGPALGGTVPAPVGRRIGASLIDSAPPTVLMLVLDAMIFGVSRVADAPVTVTVIALLLMLVWGLIQWRMHATTGQTIGKRAVGIRTLAVPAGGAPGWGRTLGRYLLLCFADFFCLGGLLFVLSVFWDKDGLLRGWHDKAANVFLVDIRNGRDPLAPGSVAASTQASTRAPEGAPVAAPVAARVQPVAVLPEPIAAPSVQRVAPVALPAAARPAVTVTPPPGPSAVAPAWAAAPVRPVPAPPVRDVSAPLSAPGPGIISSVPGLPGSGRPAVPPPPPPPPPSGAPSGVRPSAPPAALPFSPLPAPPADDDVEMTVMSLDAAAPVTEVRVVFDTGDVLPVTGRGRIGRDPVVGDEPLSHLVPLADTTKSVSKTHLEFTLGDGGLWVRDLHSTNGSSIEQTGSRTALPAGEWVRADPGAVVHLGSRTFRVEAR